MPPFGTWSCSLATAWPTDHVELEMSSKGSITRVSRNRCWWKGEATSGEFLLDTFFVPFLGAEQTRKEPALNHSTRVS